VTALGRFLPIKILSPGRQLSGVKPTLDKNFPQAKSDRELLRMKQSVKPQAGDCYEKVDEKYGEITHH
jgi:hypothetical protein